MENGSAIIIERGAPVFRHGSLIQYKCFSRGDRIRTVDDSASLCLGISTLFHFGLSTQNFQPFFFPSHDNLGEFAVSMEHPTLFYLPGLFGYNVYSVFAFLSIFLQVYNENI